VTPAHRIDLHTHSSASDGTDAPADLVANAHAAGVTALALTDHDTTAGWDEAAAARPPGMTLLRGAEFSTESPDGRGGTVTAHLLGYLFDPAHPEIVAEQERLRAARRERVRVMGERMAAGGLPLDPDELLARMPADSPAGRPHLARVLVDAGAVSSVGEAFATVLHRDGPYYVEKENTPIAAAIGMVRAAGGVAVFAHPFARRRGPCVEASVLADLARDGLAGIEVDHPDHDDADRAVLRAVAAAEDLLVTGSSDYHGTNKTTPIAAETTAPEVLDALVRRATGVEVLAG
jgi:predicted metal-dependent phosphoesterase TrpH